VPVDALSNRRRTKAPRAAKLHGLEVAPRNQLVELGLLATEGITCLVDVHQWLDLEMAFELHD
jgi:hypothetical protein